MSPEHVPLKRAWRVEDATDVPNLGFVSPMEVQNKIRNPEAIAGPPHVVLTALPSISKPVRLFNGDKPYPRISGTQKCHT